MGAATDNGALQERGREITMTRERGDVFWEKRKSPCTYFLVFISLEFKILRKMFVQVAYHGQNQRKPPMSFLVQMGEVSSRWMYHFLSGTNCLL